ncbi:hypothetical protein HHK36_014787 [Tetracentron sinense]|uniref:S-adenosylmethionine-dependent methyltransferase n=1 Tax=Tetracentron sinense TaxID=13715 RepID=A0A834Z3F0_TETSI|nr:hypothetical protein HHK36_014787 [Tetracentron sinense]
MSCCRKPTTTSRVRCKRIIAVRKITPFAQPTCRHHYHQNMERAATNAAKAIIDEEIAENLNIKQLFSALKTFRIADLGCSVGPNTFIAVHNIIAAVEHKYRSEGLDSSIPEFQVFFSDQTSNDFNTLFTTLPLDRRYFVAGVPGSFHGRLFPEASLHFVYSAYALQFLSKLPKEVVEKSSPAWNKGKIHYSNAPNEVVEAYSAQFAKDIQTFLYARSQELVSGGLLALIMPSIPNGTLLSQSFLGIPVELMGSTLMDMAKMGLVSEAKVDSFNLPTYLTSPQELEGLVERNGCFSIMKLCLVDSSMKHNAQSLTMHVRAGVEGMVGEHFGTEIIDELFNRYCAKLEEYSFIFDSDYQKGNQLFVILKRK